MLERIPNQPLKTKLFPPLMKGGLVQRPRLAVLLEQVPAYSLTLVSAPPGFGKTTLLAEWAARKVIALGWVSLDAGDNDPTRFLACLLAALEQMGRIGPDLPGLLRSFDAVPAITILEALLDELAPNPAPFALILDDYHTIHTQAVHDSLIFLLEHMPGQMHLVISTRADPPIPLARLRARGQLLELRAQDLRFTAEESSAFLNEGMAIALSAEQVRVLETCTEGWIAGLQLAALSLRGREDITGFLQAFSGSHRYILDYLVEEVISHQPEAVQQFLLQTSLLERLSAPLCDWLTGTGQGSQALLEYLERANLFLIALDDERQWFRYHHLFGDLLQARLLQADPALVPALHLRAARWLEENGWVVEAIQHCLLAKDFVQAAELIETHGQARWSLGDLTFMRLLDQLPLEMLQARPSLGVYRAWALILYGQFHSAAALVQQLRQHLPGADTSPASDAVRGFLDVLDAYITTLSGKTGTFRLPGRQALAFIPEQFLAMRNSADVMYAMLLSAQAQFDEAEEILTAAVQRDMARDGTTAIAVAVPMLARMLITQGQLHRAASLCKEYSAQVVRRGRRRFYISGNLDIVWGEILLEWNQVEEAEKKIREGIRWNEAWNIPHATLLELCVLARLQIARGDLAGAADSLSAAEAAIAGRTTSFEQLNELRLVDAALKIAQGAAPGSTEWAGSLPPGFVETYRWEPNAILLARLLLREGQHARAEELLAQLAENAAAGQRIGRLVSITLLQALLLLAQGRLVQARERLGDCLDLAALEGYTRVFLDAGAPARVLLAALNGTGSRHAGAIQQLLEAFPGETQPLAAGELLEPLTPRESEVLRWVCAGCSNQEIADKLVVSLAAVKKHTGNIYGKLGVTSRTQAIARARELGLSLD